MLPPLMRAEPHSYQSPSLRIHCIATPLGEAFVNCYLVEQADDLLLYDTGLKSSSNGILERIARIGRKPADLTTIVISHSHHDHIGAIAELAGASGASVIAHRAAEAWMVDHERQYLEFFKRYKDHVPLPEGLHEQFFAELGRPWLADLWVEQFPFDLNEGAELLHTPGHSPDGVSVHLKGHGVLIAGDCFMGAGVGGSLPQYTDPVAYAETMNGLLALELKVLLSAHFPPLRGATIAAAINQSKRIVDDVHNFVGAVVQRGDVQCTLGTLTRMTCARFGRALTPQACLTVEGHLMRLEESGRIEQENGIWRGRAERARKLRIVGR